MEVEDTWFIKLKGVGDDTSKEEFTKWLKENYMVRVIPYRRDNTARIISDVWLGNTHINRQFTNYKMDNFIQAFEEWQNNKNGDFLKVKATLKDLVRAFEMAKPVINSKKLKTSFENWMIPSQSKQDDYLEEQSIVEEEKLKEMTEIFNQWKNTVKPEATA